MSAPGSVALLCATSVLASACGALVDTAYWIDDGKTSRTVPEAAATGQVETRIEYEAAQTAGQGLHLSCYQRTRGVERGWSVTKDYEYRGGYEPAAYAGAAIVDGVVGAVVAGAFTGICLNDEAKLSCANIAWASPFAIDLVYSLIRRSTVRPKVLVGKTRGGDQMQYGQVAQEERTQCQSVAGLFLGGSSGPSDEQRLNGYAGAERRELAEGAIPLRFDEAGAVVLSAEAANLWASQSFASLWIRDASGSLQPVTVDRCTSLRPHSPTMSQQARQTFDRDCPLPQPTQ